MILASGSAILVLSESDNSLNISVEISFSTAVILSLSIKIDPNPTSPDVSNPSPPKKLTPSAFNVVVQSNPPSSLNLKLKLVTTPPIPSKLPSPAIIILDGFVNIILSTSIAESPYVINFCVWGVSNIVQPHSKATDLPIANKGGV